MAELIPLDWDDDTLPVLRAAFTLSLTESPITGVRREDVAAAVHRPADDIARILFYLTDAGYLVDTEAERYGMGDDMLPRAVRPTERALQVVARWPSGAPDHIAAQLIAALDERIERAEEPERTRLERLRDAVASISRDVLISVLTDAAKRAGGDIV